MQEYMCMLSITLEITVLYLKNCTASIVDLMGEFHQNRNNSIAFEELSVSIVDLTVYFISGRTLKSAYISSFISMFSN
jgi:hypothetical protein